jgi:RND family efflux transporter MFP subunit
MSSAPKPKSGWLLRVLVILLILGGAAYAVTYFLRPVAAVVPASRGKAIRSVPGTVEVKSEFNMALKSEVSGRVMTTELEIGRKFAKGDILLTIDPGDVDIEIDRIKNDLAAAKRRVEIGSTLQAEVANQRDTLDNLERQTKAGSYPVAEFEKAKRLYQQAVQRLDLDQVALRLALETLENQLSAREREKSKMTIVAPADGIVTEVFARAGELIGSNAPIATLISITRTIEGKLSEDNFASVEVGQRATVKFLTFGDEQYPATVSKMLPAADPTTQRYSVHLDVQLPEGREVMPGLTGEVGIRIAERANAVMVPRRALVGDYVYVVVDGQVEVRKVEKGYDSLNYVEILKGVTAGDQIVVEQQDRFKSGSRVQVKVLEN